MDNLISVRDLRNTVSQVLRRVENGERLTVTVDRRPVAKIVPFRGHRTVLAADALAIVSRYAADRGLLKDVRHLLAATAIVEQIPIVTQDNDYEAIPGVEVIRV